MPEAQDKVNPHTSTIDTDWRHFVKWQGKDDKRRVLAKNFRYGSQYFYVRITKDGTLKYNPRYILGAQGVEEVAQELIGQGMDVRQFLIDMANRYVTLTREVQYRKAEMMEHIRRAKVSRSLFGARRLFYETTQDTAKEGFNHIIQGTVVDVMNKGLIEVAQRWPKATLVHNAHDGAKLAFDSKLDSTHLIEELRSIFEQELEYEGESVPLTAQFKVITP